MEMTPYQRSIKIAVRNLPLDASLAQIAEELRSMGWTGVNLDESVIQAEMSKTAFQFLQETKG